MRIPVVPMIPAIYAAYESVKAIETLPTPPPLFCAGLTSAVIGTIVGVAAEKAIEAGYRSFGGDLFDHHRILRQVTWRDRIVPRIGATAFYVTTSLLFCQVAGDIAKSCTNGVLTTLAETHPSSPASVNKLPTIVATPRKDLALN